MNWYTRALNFMLLLKQRNIAFADRSQGGVTILVPLSGQDPDSLVGDELPADGWWSVTFRSDNTADTDGGGSLFEGNAPLRQELDALFATFRAQGGYLAPVPWGDWDTIDDDD